MKNVIKAVVIALAIMTVVSVVLTFAIPSHTGEIRQDLHEGDYIIHETKALDSSVIVLKLYVVGFDQQGNVIVSDTMHDPDSTTVMTKEEFIGKLSFQYRIDQYDMIGYSKLETEFGDRFCAVYGMDGCMYWVGEHDIIYRYSIHGISTVLKETSLIIT